MIGESHGKESVSRWIVGTTSLHLIALIFRGIQVGACPVASQWEAFSLLAWCLAVLQLFLVKLSSDRSTMFYIFTMVFLLQIASTSFSLGATTDTQVTVDSLESIHAFSALIGVAGIAIAGVHGVLWLMLRNAIKNGRFGFLFQRLSSLEELSRLNRIATGIAAGALTLTLSTSLFLDRPFYELLNPEAAVTSALWLLFGLLTLIPRPTGSVLVVRAWLSLVGFGGVVFIVGWIAINGFHAQ